MEQHSKCGHANCNIKCSNQSVCQTLSEMDWERSIWNAAFSGEEDRVRKLIEKSKNPSDAVNAIDKSGYTPLHYAARKGHIDICRLLLKNGAFINALTRCGNATPLHKAAAAGHTLTVKFLIKSGASLEIQDADGKTVLHKVIENKHFSLVEILLKASPSLKDITDLKGNKPDIHNIK